MYKLVNTLDGGQVILRVADHANIPMDESNTDYANFLKDLANDVELQNADGQVIDGKAYLESL